MTVRGDSFFDSSLMKVIVGWMFNERINLIKEDTVNSPLDRSWGCEFKIEAIQCKHK